MDKETRERLERIENRVELLLSLIDGLGTLHDSEGMWTDAKRYSLKPFKDPREDRW
jgi:hypothetical protein